MSFYVEANEPPLSLRRYKLALRYYIKLISYPQNPACNCIMETRYKNLFENKQKTIKSKNSNSPKWNQNQSQNNT